MRPASLEYLSGFYLFVIRSNSRATHSPETPMHGWLLVVEEIHLFGVPVARVAVHETLALKEQYLPEILRCYEADSLKKQPDYESDRIHTSFGLENEEQVIHPMPAAYDQLMRRFVGSDHFHARVWHSVYWSGREYQERRHQLPGHFSFMHFLTFDPAEHKRPIFYSPDGLTRAHCHESMQPEAWNEEAKVDFYAGDALVFPAYLEYSIPPGDYKNPMIIVSINVSVLGYDQGNTPRGYNYGD